MRKRSEKQIPLPLCGTGVTKAFACWLGLLIAEMGSSMVDPYKGKGAGFKA